MTPSDQPPITQRGEIVRAAVAIIGLLLALAFLWHTRLLILLTILGALLGVAAKPAVDWLERRRIKRAAGAPLVVLGSLAFLVGVAAWSAPTVLSQYGVLRRQIPAAIDRIDQYIAREHPALLDAVLPSDTTQVAGPVPTASARLGKALGDQVASFGGFFFGAVTSTLALFAGVFYVVFLTIYLSMDPFVYRRGVLLLVPEPRRVEYALLFDTVTTTLRKWLSTQFIAMVAIGAITTVVLLVLRVKAAIPLGILAGILEFVPNIGPLVSAIPAVLIAFADSPEKALFVAIAYWAIQFVENHALIPWLMKEELDLPPALTLLWQALMAIVFGVVGLFVAVPLLAATVVATRFLYVRGDVPAVRKSRGSKALLRLEIPPEDPPPRPSPPSAA